MNWLRRTDELKRNEGPDMTHWMVPKAKGLKLHGRGIDLKEILARERKGSNAAQGLAIVCNRLPVHWREPLRVLMATGWHVSELSRWLEAGGEIEPMPPGREHEAAAVLVYVHKNGSVRRTAVSEEGLVAAKFVKDWNAERAGREVYSFDKIEGRTVKRARSPFPYGYFLRVVSKAARAAEEAGEFQAQGLVPFGAGHVRHAVITAAATAEARRGGPAIDPLQAVQEFVAHAPGSPVTRDHYVDPSALVGVATRRLAIVPRKVETLV